MVIYLHFTIFDFRKRFLVCFSMHFLHLFLLLLLRLSQIIWQLFLAFIALEDSLNFITFFISTFLVKLFDWFFIFPELKSFVEADHKISVLVGKQNSLSVGNTFCIAEDAIVISLPHIYVHRSRFWRLDHKFWFSLSLSFAFAFLTSSTWNFL